MASLLDDIDRASAWIAHAMVSSGYAADFTPGSLWAVDRFLDEHARAGAARPRGLLVKNLGERLFALGAYVGEVVRRELGGAWRVDDEDPAGEVNVALLLPDGTVTWPVQRVMKRFANGAEDSIARYAAILGMPVGAAPVAPKRRIFGLPRPRRS